MKGMSPTKSGVLFLVMVLCHIGASLLLTVLAELRGSFAVTASLNIFLSQGLIIAPALLFAVFSGADARETLRFRPVKFTTLLLTVLYVICLEPLIITLNAFTMLFTDNEAMEITSTFTGENYSLLRMILIIAVIGPFCEEFVFRGVVYSGLRRSGRILTAILLQGLMFGCMHMNLNQMMYATALGIAFGFLSEVTGSIWPGFLGHFMINGSSTVMAWFLSKNEEFTSMADGVTKEMLLASCMFYAVVAIIFTSVAGLLLKFIAENEPGGKMQLYRIFHQVQEREVRSDGRVIVCKSPRAVSVVSVVALLICAVVMVINLIP